MKQVTIISALLINLVFFTGIAPAQWFQYKQVFGGNITAFASIEPKIFAASDSGGVFSSSDNGHTWNQCNTGLSDHHVNALASHGAKLYAGTNAGIFYSTNQGSSWQVSATRIPGDTVTALLAANNSLIAGVRDSGIYTSIDDGGHWQNTLFRNEVFELSTSRQLIYAATISGAYTSANNGLTWQRINTIPNSTYNTSVANDDSVVIVCIYNRDGYRSSDHGVTWKLMRFPRYSDADFTRIVMKGRFAYVGSSTNGIYFSSDRGVTWSNPYYGLFSSKITSIFLHDSTVYFGSREGIYRTTVGDSVYEAVNIALTAGSISKLTTNGSVIFAGTSYNGLLRSTNFGKSWSSSKYDSITNTVNEIAVQGKYAFAATQGSGVLRSVDEGATWNRIDFGKAVDYATGVFIDGATVYAATYNELFRSFDLGEHWSFINPKFSSGMNFAKLNGYLFSANRTGFFGSQDSGASWTLPIGTIVSNDDYRAVAVINSDLFVAPWGNGIFISTNIGESWTKVATALTVYASPWVFLWDAPKLYIGTERHGIYSSTDYGQNWQQFNEGFHDEPSIHGLLIQGSMMIAGLEQYGIWMRPIAELAVPDNKTNKLQSMTIYPNPTSGVISFTSAVEHVSIVSSLGQIVLEREIKEGEYSIDISNLPSGLYFAKLITGNSISTVKIVKQ